MGKIMKITEEINGVLITIGDPSNNITITTKPATSYDDVETVMFHLNQWESIKKTVDKMIKIYTDNS